MEFFSDVFLVEVSDNGKTRYTILLTLSTQKLKVPQTKICSLYILTRVLCDIRLRHLNNKYWSIT